MKISFAQLGHWRFKMKKLALAFTAMTAAMLGTAAQAAPIIAVHNNPTIFGSSGSFGDTISNSTGFFTDSFSFGMLSGFTLQSAGLVFNNVGGGPKLQFSGKPGLGITLNGVPFLADAMGAFHLTDQPLLLTNTIVVNGYYKATANKLLSNTFTGSLTFSGGAVPEPATWALMLLGIGGIGAGMRRRNVSALRFA